MVFLELELPDSRSPRDPSEAWWATSGEARWLRWQGERGQGTGPHRKEKNRVPQGGLVFEHAPLKNESVEPCYVMVDMRFGGIPLGVCSYLALRKLAAYHPLKSSGYTLQFNVFRLVFKGLA